MHLWAVSSRRLRAHHAWYKIIERLRWPGKSVHEINNMYNLWRTPHDSIVMYPAQREWGKEWTYENVPMGWWAPYMNLANERWNINADPWQIAEIQRLVAEHGAETFRGLDLFGCDTLAPNAPMDSSASQTPLPPSLNR